MSNNEQQETIRIAILAGILAIFFGIYQSISKETFDVIDMNFALKFLSINFFQILLVIYLIYFLILALNYGYKNIIKPKWTKFLFDLIITLTVIVVFLTFSIVGTIKLVILFPNYIQAGWKTNFLIYGSIFLSAIFFIWNMLDYSKRFGDNSTINNKNGGNKSIPMNKQKSSMGFWGWVLILTSIILFVFFLIKGNYTFAISFGVTMFLFIILIWALRIDLKEEDYKRVGKKVELNKLRLSKYQTLSVSLISIGVGIFVAGQTTGKPFGVNSWIGLGMIVVGILIEKIHVESRYKVLEDYYEKHEKEKIK